MTLGGIDSKGAAGREEFVPIELRGFPHGLNKAA